MLITHRHPDEGRISCRSSVLRHDASPATPASLAGPLSTGNLDLNCELQFLAALPAEIQATPYCKLVQHILAQESASGPWSIVIVITSDDHIQELHRQFMQIDSPTDVMTFPYEEPEQGGDIVISLDRATVQAGEFCNTAAEEVAFLVAHGMLHLLGWQDATLTARAAMLQHQATLIASFNAADSP